MRTIKKILTILFLLVVVSCGQKGDDQTKEGLNMPVVPCALSPSTTLSLILYEKTNPYSNKHYFILYHCGDHVAGQVEKWRNQEEIKALSAYMREQLENISYPTRHYAYHYVYGSLKSVSIKADMPVFGREAGEELYDLYQIHIGAPTFTFPDGEFVEQSEQFMDIDKWIDNSYIIDSTFHLYPKDTTPPVGVMGNVEFTIVTELSSGEINSDSIIVKFK